MDDMIELARKAETFMNRGDYHSVITVATEGIINYPEGADGVEVFYFLRGVAHASLGNTDNAISDVATAVQLDPSNKEFKKTLKQLQVAQYQAAAEIDDSLRSIKKSMDKTCFITTAVCGCYNKPDNCYELTQFRFFRDTWLLRQPDGKALVNEYYSVAPAIVDAINGKPEKTTIYRHIWEDYLCHCLGAIENGDFESCKAEYTRMVSELRGKYL